MTSNDRPRRAPDPARLRVELADRRSALPADEVAACSQRIVTHLAAHSQVRAATRRGPVGVYWPVRGEPDVRLGGPDHGADPLPTPHGLTLPGHPAAEPQLRSWTADTELAVAWRTLRYPADGAPVVAPVDHGMILVPALAFDHRGNRLGNGAGWYDRLLAGRTGQPAEAGPLLVGVAHGFQVVEILEAQAWDVPMDLIVTPDGVMRGYRSRVG
ncbi:MAG: 5-formyltetrahydrofolate cyclo-ligase [Microthrixaceae bacterium]|nr:5-formyltetrahydrofolate cyclo-ligase [Microthrixaceae bacterium]